MAVPLCKCGVALVESFATGDGSYEPCHACRRTAWQQGWLDRHNVTRYEAAEDLTHPIPWDGQMSGRAEVQVPADAVGKTIIAACANCGRGVAAMWDYKSKSIRVVPCMNCYFTAKTEAHSDLVKSAQLQNRWNQSQNQTEAK